MNLGAILIGFGVMVLSLGARAATGDIFINTVSPGAISAKDARMNVMPTLGNRRSVLYALRVLQARQVQLLSDIDHLPIAKSQLASTLAQKKELQLRLKFYDLVIFSVDTKWTDKPLREFLEAEFLSRAQNDINADDDDKAVAKEPLWKFFTYLSVAIRDLPEPREDLVSFIQGYIEFSSLTKPRPPADYVAQRAYSNGIVSQAAHPRASDEIGDGVERLVHARGLDKSQRRASAGSAAGAGAGSGAGSAAGARTAAPVSRSPDIELRMKLDMTPPPSALVPSILKN